MQGSPQQKQNKGGNHNTYCIGYPILPVWLPKIRQGSLKNLNKYTKNSRSGGNQQYIPDIGMLPLTKQKVAFPNQHQSGIGQAVQQLICRIKGTQADRADTHQGNPGKSQGIKACRSKKYSSYQ